MSVLNVIFLSLQLFLKIKGSFCLFTGYFQFFYRLFSIFLQVIFEKLTDIFQIFSMIILSFFKGNFQFTCYFFSFTGYFQLFYRFFSELQVFLVSRQLACNITGTFLCFYRFLLQYCTLFSIFLEVIFLTKKYFQHF